MTILIALISTALASCGTLESESTISEIKDNQANAISAIKQPDSYLITPCAKIAKLENDTLEGLLQAINDLQFKYSECSNRVNAWVEFSK